MRKFILFFITCLIVPVSFSAVLEQKDTRAYLDARGLQPLFKGGFLFKISNPDGRYFYLYGSDHNLFINSGEFPVKRTALAALEDSSYFVSEAGTFGRGMISGFFDRTTIKDMAKNQVPYTKTFTQEENKNFIISILFSNDDMLKKVRKFVADGEKRDEEESLTNNILNTGDSYVPNYWIWSSFDMRCPRKKGGNVANGVSVEAALESLLASKGLKFEELQNPAEHLKNLFQKIPLDDQVSALKAFMLFRMQPSANCGEHWLDENWDGISLLQNEYMNNAYPALENFYKVWISDRNKIFFNNMKDRTLLPGVGFFVVGSAHLLFDDGLIKLFEKDGYTVELLP